MFFLSFDWSLFFEIGLIILFVTALIVISTIFITRTLRQRYREVYKYHSKMEIELRKTANLLSKKVPDPELAKYESIAIKELSHEQKSCSRLSTHCSQRLTRMIRKRPISSRPMSAFKRCAVFVTGRRSSSTIRLRCSFKLLLCGSSE